MDYNLINKKPSVTFRQWSRKSYAIFASLGKEVNIGHVDIDISNKALQKENKIFNLLNLIDHSYSDNEELENLDTEIQKDQLLSLLSLTINSEESRRCNRQINHTYNYQYFIPFSRDTKFY